jgi:hypothetical protein
MNVPLEYDNQSERGRIVSSDSADRVLAEGTSTGTEDIVLRDTAARENNRRRHSVPITQEGTSSVPSDTLVREALQDEETIQFPKARIPDRTPTGWSMSTRMVNFSNASNHTVDIVVVSVFSQDRHDRKIEDADIEVLRVRDASDSCSQNPTAGVEGMIAYNMF